MTYQELQQRRREKWRLAGNPMRTLEDARSFLEDVGFCLMYPVHPALPLPTFIGAYVGADNGLPTARQAFSDPRAQDARDLRLGLLRQRGGYEASLFADTGFLLSPGVFPFFYALVGDKNPRQAPRVIGRGKVSQLAVDAFSALRDYGAASESPLRERLGGAVSRASINRALTELWATLRIIPVDYSPEDGATWELLHRWAPEAVRRGVNYSTAEALSALISKYVECTIAVSQEEIDALFLRMSSRSRLNEVVKALSAARQFTFVTIGEKTLIRVAPEVIPIAQMATTRTVNRARSMRTPRNG